MSGRWFRMHASVINDPKVMKLPEATRWHWVAFLCVAAEHDGIIPPADELGFLLRLSTQRVAALIVELSRAGLLDNIDGVFVPHNWDGRQFKSDSSTERVKRFRERKSNEGGNVSSGVSETHPKQSKASSKQSTADAPRAVQTDLVEEALRADLRELLGPHVDLSRVGGWLAKGYDPGMVRDVVRELRQRKPDVASLAYFDAALAERHVRRAPTLAERVSVIASIDWEDVVARFSRNASAWSRHAGPEPGQIGCRAPADILVKYGIDPATGMKIRKVG